MNKVIASGRDTLRSQLWPLPVLGVIVAAAAGVTLPMLDGYVDEAVPLWLSNLLFGGDAGAARTLLDAIASSLITVTSLTFSLTVVTLQLASSQFSPRLLRTFTSDIFVQGTLALFLSTFTYALTVLRAVRSGDTAAAFVPRIAVTVAFVRLVTAGLIDRRPHPDSRRELVVTLTRRGSEVVGAVTAHRRDEIARVVARMAPGERRGLVRALTAFTRAGGEVPVNVHTDDHSV